MKGIVFNILEECVRAEFGEDVWDDLLDAAGLDGSFTSLGTYGDEQLYAIVGAASKKLGLEPFQVIKWFGTAAAGIFAQRFGDFFKPHTNTRSFLNTLNSIIHPEVRKLYPGAGVPSFTFGNDVEGRMVMHYHSHRKLCALAEGLITGSAKQFGEQAHITQSACVHRGDEHCTLVIGFTRDGGTKGA